MKFKLMVFLLLLTFNSYSNTPSDLATNDRFYNFIYKWLGSKYKYGGTTYNSIDCSAFTMKLYETVFGVKIPRVAKQQYIACKKVSKLNLRIGDLIFFRSKSPSGWHVGVYIDGGLFVHAANKKSGVKISDLNEMVYRKTYISGGRFF